LHALQQFACLPPSKTVEPTRPWLRIEKRTPDKRALRAQLASLSINEGEHKRAYGDESRDPGNRQRKTRIRPSAKIEDEDAVVCWAIANTGEQTNTRTRALQPLDVTESCMPVDPRVFEPHWRSSSNKRWQRGPMGRNKHTQLAKCELRKKKK